MWQPHHILRVVFHDQKCQKEEMQNCQKWRKCKLFGNCFTSLLNIIICFLCLAAFLLDLLPYDVMIVAVLGEILSHQQKCTTRLLRIRFHDTAPALPPQPPSTSRLSHLLHHGALCKIKSANDTKYGHIAVLQLLQGLLDLLQQTMFLF